MNREDLDKFLAENPQVEKISEEDGILMLRHKEYDKEDEFLAVDLSKLNKISAQMLLQQLVAGRNVSHITRVTGYMSTVEGWNKGKIGELKDRARLDNDHNLDIN